MKITKEKKPIYLIITKENFGILRDAKNNKKYILTKGVILEDEYDEFILISKEKEKVSRKAYQTANPIIAVTIENNMLIIYEKEKYFPWQFSLDGNLINSAKVYECTSFDRKYLEEDFHAYYRETEAKNEYPKQKTYQNNKMNH